MSQRPKIEVRRIYDHRGTGRGGYRVLVDRLWPRGTAKAEAALDEWLKDAAPSTELRRWYSHDPNRFADFARRYRSELRRPPGSAAVHRLRRLARAQAVTILTATSDVQHSGAQVLYDHLVTGDPGSDRRARRGGR
jgi:uncharacterized protein YeaO (DUF488 family)